MYAVDYAGMLRIKQLYRVPGGIKIRSINREYEDELITGEILESFRVIGKVFWSASFHS
jgi:phage repressor protein C with HTH and peptisase S24 domain